MCHPCPQSGVKASAAEVVDALEGLLRHNQRQIDRYAPEREALREALRELDARADSDHATMQRVMRRLEAVRGELA